MDTVSYALALEEISRACASTGVIMSVNNSLVCDPILQFGTDAQKQAWLPPLAAGKKLGCFALSEPEAGSDAAAQKTAARREGDRYVLNGTKNFITNGPVADVVVLMAMTEPGAGHKRHLRLPGRHQDARACSFGPPDDKLGIRGAPSAQMFLTDCAVPGRRAAGQPRATGFKVAHDARSTAGASASPRRRWASPARRSRPPPATPRSARPSASPSPSTRPSSSSWPTCAPRSTPRAC